MEAIEQAIRHGALAGKLRAYVRENGGAGLGRLADRESAASKAALTKMLVTVVLADDRPGR